MMLNGLCLQQILLLFACVAPTVLGDLYSSMAHLQTALYAEKNIAQEIRAYIQDEQDRLEKLKAIAEDFEHHSNTALENPDFYLGNPVNAFLFVKHFTLDWDRDIETVLKNNSKEAMTSKIDELKSFLPTYEDLTGSVNALLRLQDTYKLDTSDLAQGNVGGVQSSKLTAEDCFELGRISYNDEDYYHTLVWMEEALARNEGSIGRKTISEIQIFDYLAFSYYKQGNIRRALALTNELLTLDPNHERALGNKAYYEKMIRDEEQNSNKRGDEGDITNKRPLDEYRSGEEFKTYEALCRGENTMKVKDAHKLICRYHTGNGHPNLILTPVKEEVMHFDPFLTLYHDTISDSEINLIKELAIPKLGRATVHNPKTGKLETANYRVSKSCWLTDSDDPKINKLNSHIQAITGLTMDTAEELQISNYGIGGQYEPHFDFARKREPSAFEKRIGNRIATFMYYMSDVQAGGATVFPYLGLKIFPKKGAAIFWYNLFKSGEGIYNTRHAACPVLVGSKWVSNKWIHERGQEFRRQCGLSADE